MMGYTWSNEIYVGPRIHIIPNNEPPEYCVIDDWAYVRAGAESFRIYDTRMMYGAILSSGLVLDLIAGRMGINFTIAQSNRFEKAFGVGFTLLTLGIVMPCLTMLDPERGPSARKMFARVSPDRLQDVLEHYHRNRKLK